ncbi:MAG: hypothetical protein AB7O59_19065 [Pirellulales bacterium]
MLPTIAILGGSSPFTVALVDALAADARVPAACLVLQGRSVRSLELVSQYATHRLRSVGWQIRTTADIDAALDGAEIIVHQVRYGGMEGRAQDEQLAAECGAPPDETLGPAGLQAALRAADELDALGERVARVAPQAWLLNLTNPLSIATAMLARHVGQRCIGLCELPWQTVREACELLHVEPEAAHWCYAGLNHRGFVYRLSSGGDDLLARLAALPPETSIGGIDVDTICQLGALPVKYFRLMLGGNVIPGGRAAVLADLRTQILQELDDDPHRTPPSLAQRATPWYPLSVVPVIASILCDDGRRHVASVIHGDIAVERPVAIRGAGWQMVDQPPPGAAVNDWIERFTAHEQAALAAVRAPDRDRIARAVELDPLTPAGMSGPIADRLSALWCRSHA